MVPFEKKQLFFFINAFLSIHQRLLLAFALMYLEI